MHLKYRRVTVASPPPHLPPLYPPRPPPPSPHPPAMPQPPPPTRHRLPLHIRRRRPPSRRFTARQWRRRARLQTATPRACRAHRLAVGESSVILLHPPLLSVGVSIATMRGCQQNDSLADGDHCRRLWRRKAGLHRDQRDDRPLCRTKEMMQPSA